LAFVRVSRDKRGYEHIYLIDATARRGKASRPRVLYWFRTPPGVMVGREPFDESVRHTLEAQYPDVTFDWEVLRKTAVAAPEVEPWRERRRVERAAKQARQASERDEVEATPHARVPEVPEIPEVLEVPEVLAVLEASGARPAEPLKPFERLERLERLEPLEPLEPLESLEPVEPLGVPVESDPVQAAAFGNTLTQTEQRRRRRRRGGRRRKPPSGPDRASSGTPSLTPSSSPKEDDPTG
jgi:hypothetical protein